MFWTPIFLSLEAYSYPYLFPGVGYKIDHNSQQPQTMDSEQLIYM